MKIDFTYFYPIYGAENSFICLLAAVLFLLAVISFVKSKFDVLNPSFIYCVCMAGFCMLAALYTEEWDLPMHYNTAGIMIVMSVLFLLGTYMADYCCSTSKDILLKKECEVSQGFFISWPIWIFFIVLLLSFAYLSYTEFLTAASRVTTETEFTKMLKPFINGLAHQQIIMSRWNSYRFRFANGMAYLSILAVWINIMAHQYKEVIKWSCFILLFIPFMILTGGRQQFMYLVMFAMVSFFLVYRKSHRGRSMLSQKLMIIGIALVAFLFCFLGIGVINGKIGSNTSFLNVLVHYAGTNISAFDVYINEMVMPDTKYIGTTTLDPIYIFLNNHGFDVPRFYQYITLFTAFGPVTTNVYTAFYRYIHDFGYLGCGMVMILLGFFYTYMYRQLYLHGLKNWMILIYASIVYPIFLMGREERFFNEILTTGKISFLIEVIVLYKFFEFLSKRRMFKDEFKFHH